MPSRSIVFLVYLNRSGSTFLANQLSRHPQICVCPEAHRPLRRLLGLLGPAMSFRDRVQRLLKEIETEEKFSSWGLTRDEIAPRLQSCEDDVDVLYTILDAYADKIKPKASTVVVKGLFYLDLIESRGRPKLDRKRNLKVIFLVRDARAIFNSQRVSISSTFYRPMQTSAVRSAQHWKRYVSKIAALEPKDWAEVVRYETLIVDVDKEMAKLIANLGLSVHVQLTLDSPQLAKRIPYAQKRLHANITAPAIPRRIDAWRTELPLSDRQAVEFISLSHLRRLGYERPANRSLRGAVAVMRDCIMLIIRIVMGSPLRLHGSETSRRKSPDD